MYLRIELKVILYVFKSTNNLAPSYPSMRSTLSIQYHTESEVWWSKTRAFAVAGPRLWNSLYIDRQCLTVFKSSLSFLWLLIHYEFMVWICGFPCVLCLSVRSHRRWRERQNAPWPPCQQLCRKIRGRSDVDRILVLYLKGPQSKQACWSCADWPQVGYKLNSLNILNVKVRNWSMEITLL